MLTALNVALLEIATTLRKYHSIINVKRNNTNMAANNEGEPPKLPMKRELFTEEEKEIIIDEIKGLQEMVRPHKNYSVVPTHINDPSSFFVRLAKYNDYMYGIELEGESVDRAELKVFSDVLYKSTMKNKYIRGRLMAINTNEDTGQFQAVDYGFYENHIPLRTTKKPYLSEMYLPPLALHCKFKLCEPVDNNEFDERCIKAMKEYIGDERGRIFVTHSLYGRYFVEYYNNSCRDEIAMLLALTSYTTMGVIEERVDPKELSFLGFMSLKMGDEIVAQTLSGRYLDEFYVARSGDYIEYEKIGEGLRKYCSNHYNFNEDNRSTGLQVREAVAVLVETEDDGDRYERAIIKKVMDKSVVVYLADAGGSKTFPYRKVWKLPAMFCSMPALSIYCEAVCSQLYEYSWLSYLRPMFPYTISVKKASHNFDTPNIVEIIESPH